MAGKHHKNFFSRIKIPFLNLRTGKREPHKDVELREMPKGFVVAERGKTVTDRYARIMRIREEVMRKHGIKGKVLDESMYLFRLRKATQVLGELRGVCSLEMAKELLVFEKGIREMVAKGEYMRPNMKVSKKEALKFYDNIIGNLEAAIKEKRSPLSGKVDEDLVEHYTRDADGYLLPKSRQNSQIIGLNPIVPMSAFEEAVVRVRFLIGEPYDAIKKEVNFKRQDV